jgi:hypothetical protein
MFIHTRAVIEVAYENYRREIQYMAQRSQLHVLNLRVVLREWRRFLILTMTGCWLMENRVALLLVSSREHATVL